MSRSLIRIPSQYTQDLHTNNGKKW